MVYVAIIGTGDFAHGIAHLFMNCNSESSGNVLVVTKPGMEKGSGSFHRTSVPLVKFEEVMWRADAVILAIPAAALKAFVTDNIHHHIKDKVLIDATNSTVRGEDLDAMLCMTNIRWVKAFNDIGAVDVLLNKPHGKNKIVSNMCSSHVKSLAAVKKFGETSLGLDVKVVPYERYADIVMQQNSLGDEWMKATLVMVITLVLTEIYAIVRYNVHAGYDWSHWPLQVTNKAVCWTALTGFALTQVPGVLARLSSAIHGDSLRDKPKWLLSFLAISKHLGLLSLWFLSIHIIMSLLLFNPAYYGKFFIDTSANTSKLNAKGENSFFFAILGTALYSILGICSFPSVRSQMTSKQWQLVYGPVAWVALAFGTIHVLIMGVPSWSKQSGWPGNLPPISLTATVFPLFVMGLKCVQVTLSVVNGRLFSKQAPAPKRHIINMPDLVAETEGASSRSSDTSEERSGHSQALIGVASGDAGDAVPKKASSKVKILSPSIKKLPSKRKLIEGQPGGISVGLGLPT